MADAAIPKYPEDFLTSKEASKRFGLHRDYITELCRQGKVRGTLVGRQWFVDASALAAFIRATSEHQAAIAEEIARKRREEYRRAQARAASSAAAAEPAEHVPHLAARSAIGAVVILLLIAAFALPTAGTAIRDALAAHGRADGAFANRVAHAAIEAEVALGDMGAKAGAESTRLATSLMGNIRPAVASIAIDLPGGFPYVEQSRLAAAVDSGAMFDELSAPMARLWHAYAATVVHSLSSATNFVGRLLSGGDRRRFAAATADSSPSAPEQQSAAEQPSPSGDSEPPGAVTADVNATSTPTTTTTVIEKTVYEYVPATTSPSITVSVTGIARAELDERLAALQAALESKIDGGSNQPPTGLWQTIAYTNAAAGNSTGATLNSATVNGVAGLTDADIPDGITAANYLPLTGGTISGDLTISGAFTGATLTLAVASTTLLSVLGPAYFGTTATSTFATDGALTLAALGTFGGGFLSQASSTVVGDFTTTGANTLNGALTVAGDTTLVNATTSSLFVNGTASALSAAFGATATSSFSTAGALTLASALTVPNGGTGWGSVASGALLYGNGTGALATTTQGTAGQVLALLNGVPTWTATTTFSSGLAYSNGNVTNAGVLSLAHTYGSTQTGALTLATSSATSDGVTIGLNITNSGGAFTLTPTRSGTLTAAGGGTGLASVSAAGILLGNYAGTGWQQLATSTLGLLTTHVAEGSNLYWTNDRFDARLAASTTIPTITALAGLSTVGTITSGSWQGSTIGVGYGGTGASSFGQGWLYSSGGAAALAASTSPTVNYLTATSTTATSLINGHLTVAGNTTLQNATTTSLFVKQALASNTASFGGTATSTFSTAGALTLASALSVSSGGTGATSLTSGQLLYGAGTGALQSVATSSIAVSGPLSYSGTLGALVGGAGGTLTITQATGSASGYLSSADWTVFNNKVSSTSLSAVFPLAYNSSTGAFTYNGLSTSTAAVIGNIPYFSGANTFANVATTSATLSSEFSYSGTLGAFVGGSGGTLSVATNGLALGKIAQIAANTILGNPTGATGNIQAVATSSLGIALADTTGTLAISRGGTNATSFATANGVVYYDGTKLTNGANLTFNGTQTTAAYASTTALTVSGTAYFAGTGIWNSSGNVGIGTTSPNALLDLATATNGSTNEYGTLRLGLATGVDGGTSGFYSIGRRNTDGYLSFRGWQNTNSGYHFSVNTGGVDTERLTILNSGNVGIGTTSPTSILEIGNATDAAITANITNSSAGSAAYAEFNLRNDYGAQSGLRLAAMGTGWTSAAPFIQDAGILAADNNLSGGLSIAARASGAPIRFYTVNTERLRIDSAGNVGVATGTPFARLSVTGAGTGTGYTFLAANSSNVPLFNIQDNGNVGIGTTTPGAFLHVLGTTEQLRLGYSSTAYQNLTVASDGGATWGVAGTAADLNFDFSGATDGDFSVNTDDLFVDTSTGNVAIGASGSIAAQFQITGTHTNQITMLMNGTNNSSNTANLFGINMAENFNPAGASLSQLTGIRSNPILTGSALDISSVHSVISIPQINAGYTGVISNWTGFSSSDPVNSASTPIASFHGFLQSAITNGNGTTTGTVTNNGFYFQGATAAAGAGGTINNYGVRITQPSGNTSGTSNYGLHISGAGGASATNNYSLYNSSTANSYFAGNVGIGTTSPIGTLDVGTMGTVAGTGVPLPSYVAGVNAQSSSGDTLLLTNGGATGRTSSIQFRSSTSGAAQVFSSGRILSGYTSTNYTSTYLTLGSASANNTFNDELTLKNGNVGIASTTPWKTLSVSGTVALAGLTNDTADAKTLCLTAANEVVANTGSTCITSSARFKQNIEPLDDASGLDEVLKLNPVAYEYRPEIGVAGKQVGFIAEEIRPLDERLAVLDAQGRPFTVRYENLTAILAKAIQEIATISGAFKTNLTAFLADAGNGIHDLYASVIRSEEAHTKKLCVADDAGAETCVTKAQLDALLRAASPANSPASVTSPATADSPESVTPSTPTPTPEPAQDQTASSAPTEPEAGGDVQTPPEAADEIPGNSDAAPDENLAGEQGSELSEPESDPDQTQTPPTAQDASPAPSAPAPASNEPSSTPPAPADEP